MAILDEALASGRAYGNTMSDRKSPQNYFNVGSKERWLSAIIGGALLLYGVKRARRNGLLPALLGGALVYRGATGHCSVYKLAGIDTADQKRPGVSVPHGQGVKVEHSMVVNKSPEELYRFWRNPENLPRFMSHVASVQTFGDKRSHWKMKSVAGTEFQWDAEIFNDKAGELIAWRTLEGADLDHAGSVHFERLPGDRGTEVKVVMEYRPPAGKLGVAVAKVMGEEPEQVIDTDLRRFKELMETGVVAEPQNLTQH